MWLLSFVIVKAILAAVWTDIAQYLLGDGLSPWGTGSDVHPNLYVISSDGR